MAVSYTHLDVYKRQSLGYTPVKQQGRNLWYKSPLREETDASFKVNTELEKWYDFGSGKGGNIIALAAELYHSEDVAYLLKRIEERTAYIRPASFSFGRQHSDNQPYQGLRVGAVSYTHLDVYKRQISYITSVGSPTASPPMA